VAAGVALLACVMASAANAQVYTWDGNGSTAPNPTGGSGTWDTTTANWWTGSNVTWPTAGTNNDAVFANTAGTVTISGGVTANDLTFSTNGYTVTGGTLTLNGSTPTLNSVGTATINSAVLGTAGLTKSGAGLVTISGPAFGANTLSGAVVVASGTLQLNGGGNGAASGRGLPSASSFTINPGATLVSQGNDPLGGGNAPITINSGTLRHATGSNWFASLGALTLNAGTLLSAQGAGASFQGFALNGTVTVGGSAASTIGTQETTNNAIHLFFNGSNPAQQRTFDVADATGDLGADLIVSAPLINSSHTGTAAGLIKTGVGLMVLTGSNSYTGATTISNGILVFQNKNTRAGGSAVTAAAAGTVGLGVGADGVSDYSDSDVASLFNSTLSGFTLNAASGVAIDTTAGNFTQSTALTAARALTKLGSNTLSLTGSNTYSGNTAIGAGTLQIGNGGTTGSINSASTISGSTGAAIAFNRSDDLTFSNTISGGVGLSKNASNAVRLTGAVSYTGTTTITAGVLDFGFVSGTTTWTAPIVGSSGTFRYSGAGTLAVSSSVGGANSFTGAVVVDSGVLQMGLRDSSQSRGFTNASSFTVNSGATLAVSRDSMIATAPITLNSGTLTAGSVGGSSDMYQALGPIAMNAGTIVTGQGIGASFNSLGLNGDVTVAGSAASQILAGVGSNNGVHLAFNAASGSSRTFTVADVTSSAAADLTVSAALLNSSHTSGTINLVKAGLGTMRLTGVNTYTGTTAVNAGTLLVDGNNSAATGAVTVASGATLGGSGTLGGTVTVNGILSPGSSPGVLTAPSILLGGSSTSIFEIDGTVRGTGYDGVTITQSGGLTYGGVLSLALSGTFANDTTFDLFNFAGAPLGSFSSVTASGPYGSLTFTDNGSGVWTSGSTSVPGQTMTFTQSTGDLVIVPEPGALALAAAGVGLAAAWALRRRP
jgi:autotransporter-associated beta strand protein